jgi:predicted amidohydrolase YtcJ
VRRAALAGLILVAVSPLRAQEIIVLENGRVWTNDPVAPEATGLVIRGDRIVAVARGHAIVGDSVAGASIRRIDLGGRRVVPGFNDAHTHFIEGSLSLLATRLFETDTPEEFARRLGEHAAKLPEGQWINLPAAWDHERWPEHPLPSRQLIDSVTAKNPVWILRPDGHIGLANSLALALAGITRDTPDPPGGAIDRDPSTGEPTGIVRDAGQLFSPHIPAMTEEHMRTALDAALEHAARMGVTSIQDMCYDYGPPLARLYQEYARAGKLTTRIYCRTWLADWKELATSGVTAGSGDRWVRMGSLKEFLDGGIGASTAWFFDDYDERPGYRGLPNEVASLPDTFYLRAKAADEARLQLSIHAIGDAAISFVVDVLERVREDNPAWDRRWRIEHAQHMARKDFARMAELGVIASVQPAHVIDDGRFVERKIGHDRATRTYAFRSFLDAGVPTAFGTDWPVAPLDPWRTVYAAVTRIVPEVYPDGWIPEERITLEEALVAYTSGSAYAEFTEREKGRLAPGYLADLVVLSEDPWALPPERLDEVRSVMTIVGGRIVWSSGEIAGSR